MAFKVGDHVRVLAPYNNSFPGVYTVDAVKGDGVTYSIYGDRDFAEKLLELTLDPVTHPSPSAPEPEPDTLAARLAKIEGVLIDKAVLTEAEIDAKVVS